MSPVFVCVGLYFCSAIDQFSHLECGIVDPVVDGVGRTWRLVSTDYLNWMAGMIRKAFETVTVSDAELSAAIVKFYRVRDRLEAEWEQACGANGSDGDQHSLGGAGAAADGELAADVAA